MSSPDADASDRDREDLRVIALEEHFWTAEIRDALSAVDDDAVRHTLRFPGIDERLRDLGERRLARMDEAGVDVQVLSVTTPGTQMLAAAEAVPLARHANDVAADATRRHPTRSRPGRHSAARLQRLCAESERDARLRWMGVAR